MPYVARIVFAFVYLGMIAGRIPGLALDRTGVALLGAIVLVAFGTVSPEEAWQAIDVPTIGLLLGLMVVSAQFRLGGFYSHFTARLAGAQVRPATLLALVIIASGVLSALLCNDIICLAMAPILADGCARKRLNPIPYLLALACAANVGSAATLIGNPQNMLIGQVLQLRFDTYLWQAAVPSVLGLATTWLVIAWSFRGHWHRETSVAPQKPHEFDRWQTTKAFVVLAALTVAFLIGQVPREVVALTAAAVLLTSRRMSSHEMLQLVDWHLLVLFGGLFVVNHAIQQTGDLQRAVGLFQEVGINASQPAWMFVISVVLSNIVSNVPAVMLLLPFADHPLAGPVLALSSTLAGNLLIVGSIANIIVVDHAARLGLRITWRDHAKIGVPVTLLTLVIAAAWCYLLARFPMLETR